MLRAARPALEGPGLSPEDQVTAAIETRAQRFAAASPRGVQLEARVLLAMRRALAGTAAALSGKQPPEHFRESLRGERVLTFDTFCRLATEPTREARDAVRAALAVLLDHLESAPPLPVEACESFARVTETMGELAATGQRALADGRIDSGEIVVLERRKASAEKALATVDAVLARARRQEARP
jgi:hypothetical protein